VAASTQTTSIINLKRSTLHPHEGQADRPNTPSDSKFWRRAGEPGRYMSLTTVMWGFIGKPSYGA
jgi:hypothetical protein